MNSLAFWQGIDEFNHHEFYASHDTLEELWMEAVEPDKRFYQGVLQIAVACYHLTHQNWQGAVTLLGEGIHRLRDYEPVYHDINVTQLVRDSYHLLQQLQSISPDQCGDFWEKLQMNPHSGLPKIIPVLVEDRKDE